MQTTKWLILSVATIFFSLFVWHPLFIVVVVFAKVPSTAASTSTAAEATVEGAAPHICNKKITFYWNSALNFFRCFFGHSFKAHTIPTICISISSPKIFVTHWKCHSMWLVCVRRPLRLSGTMSCWCNLSISTDIPWKMELWGQMINGFTSANQRSLQQQFSPVLYQRMPISQARNIGNYYK